MLSKNSPLSVIYAVTFFYTCIWLVLFYSRRHDPYRNVKLSYLKITIFDRLGYHFDLRSEVGDIDLFVCFPPKAPVQFLCFF